MSELSQAADCGKRITLVRSYRTNGIYLFSVKEFYDETIHRRDWSAERTWPPLILWFLSAVYRTLDQPRLFSRPLKQRDVTLAMVMDVERLFEYSFPGLFRNSAVKALYLFDAWPRFHPLIERIVSQLSIDILFVSARDAATMLEQRLRGVSVIWIPEGIKASDYHYLPHEMKNIDIVQFGRIYHRIHSQIVRPCQEAGLSYLYAVDRAVFPTKLELTTNLAAAKISICVPQTLTHPLKAGGVETMTLRYLQSMASKCLIIGVSPKEMRDLLGYEPVVPFDSADTFGQIASVLRDLDAYRPLIERNYLEVTSRHQWRHRAEEMTEYIRHKMGVVPILVET